MGDFSGDLEGKSDDVPVGEPDGGEVETAAAQEFESFARVLHPNAMPLIVGRRRREAVDAAEADHAPVNGKREPDVDERWLGVRDAMLEGILGKVDEEERR